MFNSATRFLASLTLVTFVLTYLWVTAASAAEPIDGMACRAKALANGRLGETVLVCSPTKPRAERRGTTVIVARLGR